jgi:hypothetical protein
VAAKAKAQSAKASRETSERIQEAVKADREEQRREEAQKQWDESMHNIGGQEFTGARLHALFEYLNDPQNADAFEQELMNSEGISKEEAKKRRMNLQEWQKLNEKERNGKELTPEEIRRREELGPLIAPDLIKLDQKVAAIEGQKYGATTSAEKTGQTAQKSEVSISARADQYEDQGDEEVQTKFTVPAKSDYSDVMSPLIKAAPLTPAFQKAEAAVVPLDSTIPKKPSAQMVVAMAAISVPQAENAIF